MQEQKTNSATSREEDARTAVREDRAAVSVSVTQNVSLRPLTAIHSSQTNSLRDELLPCGLRIARITIPRMLGRPEPNEAAADFHGYINRITSDDVVNVLEKQMEETVTFLNGISEEQSLHRYEAGKWSMRLLLNHLNDSERIFVFRALWFARGFPDHLPGFDQDTGVAGAGANEIPWAAQVEEFRAVRLATLAFFHNLPAGGWLRSGIANESPATVRAIAYILAGHVAHHTEILKQRYL